MTLKKLIANYNKHNHWANERLTKWLLGFERNKFFEEIPSSFPSIDLTLQHIKNAHWFWLAVLTKSDFKSLDESIIVDDIEKVISSLLAGSQRMMETVANFTEEELIEIVSNDATEQTRFDFIVHAINHNSYHRGQIITIARILGTNENIPCTDFETYLWLHK